MATLYITQYARLAIDPAGQPVLVGMEPSNTITVAIGGSSTQSATIQGGTKFVRLHTDTICNIAVGTNPTATTSGLRLAANQTEFFGLASDGLKIAVIAGS